MSVWVMLIGLTWATDELRMCMIYLTMAASLIMIESANNGDVAAWPACVQKKEMRSYQLFGLSTNQ